MKPIIFAFAMLALTACNKDDEITTEAPAETPAGTGGQTAEKITVYDYTPAPGQFIGEGPMAGFTGHETTPEAARAYAEDRLDRGLFVSLGGFGGYIVMGLGHSIANSHGGYDFAIRGNAFLSDNGGGMSEPGIVAVMRDDNNNRLPDDTWYELRGSEPGTRGYNVTYFRPEAKGQPVRWTDNAGQSGTIDYLAAIHNQDSYYPEWIAEDSYTLSGTLLPARNHYDQATGFWGCDPYAWGYADNVGTDWQEGGINRFRIADATDAADLDHIDFVRVQTGVHCKSGILGEQSTEVFSLQDLH